MESFKNYQLLAFLLCMGTIPAASLRSASIGYNLVNTSIIAFFSESFHCEGYIV